MRKKLIILMGVIIVAILILLNIVGGSKDVIKATSVQKSEAGIEETSSYMEITYRNDVPYKMLLEVKYNNKDVADTSYEVVSKIVEALKENNPDDATTLKQIDRGFRLKTNVKSEGFTYPKNISLREMKQFLKEEGWDIK